MNRYIWTILFFFNFIKIDAQTNFKQGYFINFEKERVDCLIKDFDHENTQNKIIYKKTEDGPKEEATIEDIIEFGWENEVKYVNRTVMIDRSRNVNGVLSQQQRAILERDTLFLRVLIDGEASLYHYQERTLQRFFYEVEGKEIEQLIYKKFSKDNLTVGTNNRFRQQLKVNMSCRDLSKTDNLGYTNKHLTKYFKAYNDCRKSDYKDYTIKQKKRKLFNIWAKSEVMYSSLGYEPSDKYYDRINQSSKKLNYQFGATIEYVFPFRKGRWSILLEPTTQNYSDEVEKLYEAVNIVEKVYIDITSLEVPLGVRHYYYNNKNSKAYLNVHYLMNWFSKMEVDYEFSDNVNVSSNNVNGNFALGAGFTFWRVGLEGRYKFGKDFLAANGSQKTGYKGLSAILSFRLY